MKLNVKKNYDVFLDPISDILAYKYIIVWLNKNILFDALNYIIENMGGFFYKEISIFLLQHNISGASNVMLLL